MASRLMHTFSAVLRVLTYGLVPLTVLVGLLLVSHLNDPDQRELQLALLIPNQQRQIPWVVLSEEQISAGATVPADTNVIFHVPTDSQPINRETLLGGRGSQVRYWGYCIPQNYAPEVTKNRQGFPGLMFLSEKERKAQDAAVSAVAAQRSIYDLKTTDASFAAQKKAAGNRLKNQLNTFDPGSLCFIMSEASLPIGLDSDGDLLNDKAEQTTGTDAHNPDSDGDGITDGVEVRTGTQPLIRDTDSDGLVDGLEDKNLNGKIDSGETDPRNRDSDRDGLCDGLCVVRVGNDQILELGEDKNLNGVVDAGETDPLLKISGKSGVNDYDAEYRCLFGDTSVCP